MKQKPLIILAVLVLVFVGLLSLVPSHFKVEKSERIEAPPAVIFSYLEDLHRWSEWSKLDSIEPGLKKTFEGPATGKGAKLHWSGSEEVGEGDVTITDSRAPDHVAWDVAWTRPEVTDAHVEVDLQPVADGTVVTMKFDGRSGFVARVFAVVIDRKRFTGTAMEGELQSLRFAAQAAASKANVPPPAPEAPAAPAEADAGTVDAGTP